MRRLIPTLVVFFLASTLLTAGPAAGDEGGSLARCAASESSLRLRDSASLFAEHVRSGYSATYPAAVILASSMEELAAALDSQLRAVEPTYAAFQTAWGEFDRLVRRSPLPRDPALGPVLPGFKRSAAQLEGLIGCGAGADVSVMVTCSAIPIAHLLAVVAGQMRQYLEGRYSDNLPEQVEAVAELDRAAKALHHVLHDLEVAVPATPLVFRALDTAFESGMLTDANDVEDPEVKSRLAAVGEAVAALDGLIASCHEVAVSHEDH